MSSDKSKSKDPKDYESVSTILGYASRCTVSENFNIEELIQKGQVSTIVHILKYDTKLNGEQFDEYFDSKYKSLGIRYRFIYTKNNESIVFLRLTRESKTNFCKLIRGVNSERINQQQLLNIVKKNICSDLKSCPNTKNWEPVRITYLTAMFQSIGWTLTDAFVGFENAELFSFAVSRSNVGTQNSSSLDMAEQYSGKRGETAFNRIKNQIEEDLSEGTLTELWGRMMNMWQWVILDLYTPSNVKRIIPPEALESIERLKNYCINADGSVGYTMRKDFETEIIDGIEYYIKSPEWMVQKKYNKTDTWRQHWSRKIISIHDAEGQSSKSVTKNLLHEVFGWIIVQPPRDGVTTDSMMMMIDKAMQKSPNAQGAIIDCSRSFRGHKKLENLCSVLEDLRSKVGYYAKYTGGEVDLSKIDFVMVLSNDFLPYHYLTPDRWVIHVLEKIDVPNGIQYDRSITTVDLSLEGNLAKRITSELGSMVGIEERKTKKIKFFEHEIESYKDENEGRYPTWEDFEDWRSRACQLYKDTYSALESEQKKKGKDQCCDFLNKQLEIIREIERDICDIMKPARNDEATIRNICTKFLMDKIDESFDSKFYDFIQSIRIKKKAPLSKTRRLIYDGAKINKMIRYDSEDLLENDYTKPIGIDDIPERKNIFIDDD